VEDAPFLPECKHFEPKMARFDPKIFFLILGGVQNPAYTLFGVFVYLSVGVCPESVLWQNG